jgi:hypothetical protein
MPQYRRCLIHSQSFVAAMRQMLVVAKLLEVSSQDTKVPVWGMVALTMNNSCLLNMDSKLRY